jgi:serine/threonine protein phosphatase 1
LPYTHVAFYNKKLVDYYETEDFIFVHAGINPNTPLKRTPTEILFWDRHFIRTDKKYKGKTVVCGHTPSKHVLNEKHKICIDTGGCFRSMGNLTCVKLPERTFYSQGATLEDLKND